MSSVILGGGAATSANGVPTLTMIIPSAQAQRAGGIRQPRRRRKNGVRCSEKAHRRLPSPPKLGTFIKTSDSDWAHRIPLSTRVTKMRIEYQDMLVEELKRERRQQQETSMDTPVDVALLAGSEDLMRLSNENEEEEEQTPIEEVTPETANDEQACFVCAFAPGSCLEHQSSMDSVDLALPVMFEEDADGGAESVMNDEGQLFSSDPLWWDQDTETEGGFEEI